MTEVQKIKLIYVMSASFSGSTLMAFILATHPQIATVGELSGPDPLIRANDYPCSCGSLLKDCAFWKNIESRVNHNGANFHILNQNKRYRVSNSKVIHHLLTRPTKFFWIESIRDWFWRISQFNQQLTSYLKTNEAVIKTIMEYYKADIFLDTSKDVDRLQLLMHSENFEIFIIHLVRDGRGQTNSKVRRGAPMKKAARWLVKFDNQAKRLCDSINPSHFIRLRYEDLCKNLPAQLRRIANLVGIEPTLFDPARINNNQLFHILGNPMKWRGTDSIELDNRWKNELSPADLKLFQKIAGSRNKDFGYHN